MSFPDYQQCAEDHQCLLIVVKQIGLYSKSTQLIISTKLTLTTIHFNDN